MAPAKSLRIWLLRKIEPRPPATFPKRRSLRKMGVYGMTKALKGGRPKVEDSLKRGPPMGHFRPTREERDLIERKAAEARLTISDYCRLSSTSTPIYSRKDNVPMELIGHMRAVRIKLDEIYELVRKKIENDPEAIAAYKAAADMAEAAFRSVLHGS